jgi:serine/threonine protein kinase
MAGVNDETLLVSVKEGLWTANDPSFADKLVGKTMDLKGVIQLKFDEVIGSGGMGVVYRGKEISGISKPRAFKMSRRSSESLEDLAREAELAGTLTLPEVVSTEQLYRVGPENNQIAIISMEDVNGPDLQKIVQTHSKMRIRIPEKLLGLIVYASSIGIQHAHDKKVIHRDIKPPNILVGENGNIKIGDFGLSILQSDGLEQIREYAGTPGYMSPEQVRGEVPDNRSDIYSFGVTIYSSLTGENPLTAGVTSKKITEILSGIGHAQEHGFPDLKDVTIVGEELSDIVAKSLKFGRSQRYQCAEDLGQDMLKYMYDGGGVGVTKPALQKYLDLLGVQGMPNYIRQLQTGNRTKPPKALVKKIEEAKVKVGALVKNDYFCLENLDGSLLPLDNYSN